MSNYSDNPAMVRVDFFREFGKWYTTEAVEFVEFYGDIHEAFRLSLKKHLKDRSFDGMWAVCLSPYHKHEHPLMLKVGES